MRCCSNKLLATPLAWAALSRASVKSIPRSVAALDTRFWNSSIARSWSFWSPVNSKRSSWSAAVASTCVKSLVSCAARFNIPWSAVASIPFVCLAAVATISLACIAVACSCEPSCNPSRAKRSFVFSPASKRFWVACLLNPNSSAASCIILRHDWSSNWSFSRAARSKALSKACCANLFPANISLDSILAACNVDAERRELRCRPAAAARSNTLSAAALISLLRLRFSVNADLTLAKSFWSKTANIRCWFTNTFWSLLEASPNAAVWLA